MISYHFSRSEFACKCGCKFDTVDIELVEVLENLATFFKDKMEASYVMILINSGCRCKEYNDKIQKMYNSKYVSGTSKSMHLFGQAADFRVKAIVEGEKITIDPSYVADYLEQSYPDKYGIGRYSNRVHLDVKTGNARRWNA